MFINIAGVALLGLCLGGLGGFLGTGGGTFAIPALVLIAGYDQKLAQGTALVMVVTNVFKALLKYRSKSGLDLKLAGMLAASAGVSATISSMWALSLSSLVLQKMYGVFLIVLAVFILASKRRAASEQPLDYRWAVLPGLAGGVSLGLFGVGGAMLAVPLLVMFYGQTQVRAQGLGLALALPGCSISLLQYAQAGHIDWGTGAILAVGGLLGVPYGVGLAHRVKEVTLVNAFCLFLVVAGTILLQK